MTFRIYELIDTRTDAWLGVFAGPDEALVAVREEFGRSGPDAVAALALRYFGGDGTTEVVAEGQALALLVQPPAGDYS